MRIHTLQTLTSPIGLGDSAEIDSAAAIKFLQYYHSLNAATGGVRLLTKDRRKPHETG